MWKQPQLLWLFIHQNYFSVSAGLLRSLTSPKAVDPYTLYLAELKVMGLGEASCLADTKKLLATQCVKLSCMHARLNLVSLHLDTYHLCHIKKTKDFSSCSHHTSQGKRRNASSSIWTIIPERPFWQAHVNCMSIFLLKNNKKKLSWDQRW